MKKVECYRAILKQEFLARKSVNARYTQAAFARDLCLAPPKLSQILSQKCGLSGKRAAQVADLLGFSQEERDYFVTLVNSQHGRSRKEREAASEKAKYLARQKQVTLSRDQFHLLKDWHHFAILNLLKSKIANQDARSLSQRLQIPLPEVKKSLELLERLGLFNEPQDDNQLIKTTQDVPSRAIRHHHEQVITKALKSLHKDPVKSREFQSLMFLADSSRMPAMKKILREQSFQFLNSFESDQARDLYSLSIQLVPLTTGGDSQ